MRGGGVEHGGALVQVGRGRGLQRLVKQVQQAVQPVAEIALAEFAFQLVVREQLELAQRKKAIRAAAQVVVSAGRELVHRQRFARGLGRQRRTHGDGAQAARVGRAVGGQVAGQQQFLHKTAGHEVFARFAGAPEQIDVGQLLHVGPGLARHGGHRFTRGQTEQFALGRCPVAGRFGRDGQAHLVAAGQHDGLHRARQQLRQRQNHHLLGHRVLGRKDLRLQRLIHPTGEDVEFHHRRVDKFAVRAVVQAQRVEHGLARRVQRQNVPLAGFVQRGAQVVQPQI